MRDYGRDDEFPRGSAEVIGIEASEGFEPPSMALDFIDVVTTTQVLVARWNPFGELEVSLVFGEDPEDWAARHGSRNYPEAIYVLLEVEVH